MTDERTKFEAWYDMAEENNEEINCWAAWQGALASQQKPIPCVWSEEYEGPWESACGHAFNIIEGGPAENGMKFCCFCGAPINAISYDEGAENEG